MAGLTRLSYILGYGLLAAGLVIGVKYLLKPTERRLYSLLFIGWIFLFYITNWIFGGGGVYTILSSGHRYLALSAVGVIALVSVILSSLPKRKVLIFSLILIVLNLRYSSYLIGLESLVRDRDKIIPIHREIMTKVSDDESVRFLLIDTPNRLKSFLAGGWFPYTFAYYRGLSDISDFPTVFSFWQSGLDWLCAKNDIEKDAIAHLEGVSDYQKGKTFTVDDIYAWSVSEDGKITDRTETLRQDYQECMNR